MNTQLVWFRRNLRLNANPALLAAASGESPVIGAFIYDEQYTGSQFGLPRCNPLRAGFLWQSLAELRDNLRSENIPLIIRESEDAATALLEMCRAFNVSKVHTQKLWAYEEQQTAARVRQQLASEGIELVEHECYTLLASARVRERHPQALVGFSKFRRKVEKNGVVDANLWHLFSGTDGAPENGVVDAFLWHHKANNDIAIHEQAENYAGNLFSSPIATKTVSDERATLAYKGGEREGLQRLEHYCSGPLGHYKETRNGMIGKDYSSKLSPWLNLGCISPVQVYAAVQSYIADHGANASTEWLVVELLWRDFFQFFAAERGASLFYGNNMPLGVVPEKHVNDPNLGIGAVPEQRVNDPNFWGWARGTSGGAFLDANMRELNATGFMSNRGRQNVASALIHDLQLDWRLGAAWFEAQLLDYDPASNYGNWQYIAGLAANPRGGSWFNLEKQANVYDTDGEFRRMWGQ